MNNERDLPSGLHVEIGNSWRGMADMLDGMYEQGFDPGRFAHEEEISLDFPDDVDLSPWYEESNESI